MKIQDLIDAWRYAQLGYDEYWDHDIMATKKVDSFLKEKESKEMSNVTYGAYCKQDIDSVSKMIQNRNHGYLIPGIAKVIYNPPATIILWEDETKTVVKCCETDIYDPEKGFAMAVIKKLCGNMSAPFHRLFKTWCLESEDKPDIQLPEINIGDIGSLLKDAVNKAIGALGNRR